MSEAAVKRTGGFRLFGKKKSVLPGFGLSMGVTLVYLSLVVLVPLSMIVLETWRIGWARFWQIALDPRAIASYKLSFGASLVAALVNAVFGVILAAGARCRYRFFGKGFIDALIDLPFALPTAVGGIALTGIYYQQGMGWGASSCAAGDRGGVRRLGVVIALIFVGLPLVVRAVNQVLVDLNLEQEEAAATLGASRFQTFVRVMTRQSRPR